jgi:hypothetical protein
VSPVILNLLDRHADERVIGMPSRGAIGTGEHGVYRQRVTRNQPGLFVFLLDQSTSMHAGIAGRDQSKASFVADVLNSAVADLSFRCAREDGIRDYAHVVVIGYGDGVSNALPGQQLRRPISALANDPLRIEQRRTLTGDGAGGLVERDVQLPVWVEPVASGLTPMVEALELAAEVVEGWVREFPAVFPPIVMNITDGGATDGDPLPVAERLRKVGTSDGDTLLFNVHVSDAGGDAILYPSAAEDLDRVDDALAATLFEMSSPLPAMLVERASASGVQVGTGARGMVYLADASDVVRFVDIGTSTV